MDEGQIDRQMQEVVARVREEIGAIRTGRATPSLVEDVVIAAYGGQQSLRVQELATITATDPQTLLISPWDQSIIGEIKKGIEDAKLGLSPVIAGESIRINLPPMTEEDRENYIKLLKTKLENGRIAIRQIRQESMRDIKKRFEGKELSEDQMIAEEKRLQETTDKNVRQIDEIGGRKEEELRSV